jgi:hypothetical protein
VTDHKDIPDLKTPIECEDEDVSEYRELAVQAK